MEIKQAQMTAFDNALEAFDKVSGDFFRLTKKRYQPCEGYNLEEAEVAIVVVGSTAGTVRHFIDQRRQDPKKIGLLKISLFRPFPYRLVSELLSTVKQVVVLERVPLLGSVGPLTLEINSALYTAENLPTVSSFVYGLLFMDLGDAILDRRTCKKLLAAYRFPPLRIGGVVLFQERRRSLPPNRREGMKPPQ